jgi:PhzF family phenazine biosynthesis protein
VAEDVFGFEGSHGCVTHDIRFVRPVGEGCRMPRSARANHCEVPVDGNYVQWSSTSIGSRFVLRLPYFVVDAFASAIFRGNPAGVCPLQRWLPEATLQSIAAENNLAETAFFVPDDPGYHLRWFTPTQEVPLCGHATLASAFIVFNRLQPDLRNVHFHTLSGPLSVARDGDWLVLDLPRYAPVHSQDKLPELERGLGVHVIEAFRVDDDPNYYAVVSDEETVRQVHPQLDVLAALHPYGVCVTAAGPSADFVSRYFAPSYGIPEDPATGSIHAALTPYWNAQLHRTTMRALQLSHRGGELRCELLDERVRVAGQAFEYLEGQITVP